ncbi:hypothetical protein SAMN05216243_2604 [Sediminibacillus albus]|uniref:Uncharacterized protein n=1 Tax=Sediminibacillus albus TaxID=407036 RepID=A0A1G9AM86_9BACI|nr:hypothetical protein SAMN05216243_2604 [Sediminibacillus albus]
MFTIVRLILIGVFSFSAICLFAYQGIEIFHSIRAHFINKG